jgi:hypothetical protein
MNGHASYWYKLSCVMFCSSGVLPQAGPAQQVVTVNPLMVTFNEYMSCPHHRDIVLGLSAILQVGFIYAYSSEFASLC